MKKKLPNVEITELFAAISAFHARAVTRIPNYRQLSVHLRVFETAGRKVISMLIYYAFSGYIAKLD